MRTEQLSRDDVVAFLIGRSAVPMGIKPTDIEPLTGGLWSSAWAYRTADRELVVRFGRDRAWYEADRGAMAFAGPDLPVPAVLEVGTTPDGRAYAISERHHGGFLEDTPAASADALAPTLTRLLAALFAAPGGDEAAVLWSQPQASPASWRDFLLDGLADDPDKLVHGWRTALAKDRRLDTVATAAEQRLRELLDACPERRDLVHGDLLHGNVLISERADHVEAVLSWKCSVRGDFLFDAAWCTYWSSFHPGIAAADPLRVLRHPSVRADPGALVDAAARHHCYELHIGFTHLGWNVWTQNHDALTATADRLAEVLERGPLPLVDP